MRPRTTKWPELRVYDDCILFRPEFTIEDSTRVTMNLGQSEFRHVVRPELDMWQAIEETIKAYRTQLKVRTDD